MAIGEWVDNRATFFFQKIALSADVDSLAENDHRLLVQAGQQYTIGYDCHHPQWNTDAGRALAFAAGGAAEDARWIDVFSFALWDRCPWNRLRVATYLVAMATPGNVVVKLQRSTGHPGTGGLTDVVSILGSALTVGAWNVWANIDITGLAQGMYTWEIFWECAAAASFEVGPTHVSLMSTVTGLIS